MARGMCRGNLIEFSAKVILACTSVNYVLTLEYSAACPRSSRCLKCTALECLILLAGELIDGDTAKTLTEQGHAATGVNSSS